MHCICMYVGLSTIVYGKPIKKICRPKCVGGITPGHSQKIEVR